MCCIIDNLISDLFTFCRQFWRYLVRRTRGSCKSLLARGSDHGTSDRFVTSTREPSVATTTITIKGNSKRDKSGRQKEAYLYDPTRSYKCKSYNYKMMSKKGLLKFVKYTLIFSNAFGFILSIFLGLFGLAYPDKHFPLSYKGREMALCSLFCMLFTTIGYCGAQNHRRILLIIYGATNVIIVIIVVILWFLFRENSILGNKEISNMFITTLAITIAVMFLFAFTLAFHIQTFKDDAQDSIVSQSHQLLQQTTAFLQQQQQQLQQQQQQQQQTVQHTGASISGTGGGVGHHAQAPLGTHNVSVPHHHHLGLESQNYPPGQASHDHHQLVPPPLHHQTLHQQLSGGHDNAMVLMDSSHQHHAPSAHRLVMMQQQQHQSIPMTQLKSSGSSQRAKSKQSSAGGALMMQAPPGSMALMRNQSSPLPDGGGHLPTGSAYQTTGRSASSSTATAKQLYSQSQKHSRIVNELSSGVAVGPSSPPPPPPPPPVASSLQADAAVGHHHHHNVHPHQHQQSRNAGQTNRLPPCPVQYCTFDCDRTV